MNLLECPEVKKPNSIAPITAEDLDARFGADWGPEKYGAKLLINPGIFAHSGPLAVDVETDEHDNFVGAAICSSDDLVIYVTEIDQLKTILSDEQLIGHNLKGDLRWLKKWGVNVSEANLYHDTMIASYVVNPIRDSHGLKPLSSVILGLAWPSYSDMVGKGRKRQTLNNQSIERVSRYCGMDCLATWRLNNHFQRTMTPNQRRIYGQIEMPINRILYRMEDRGVQIDVKLLAELDTEFARKIKEIVGLIHELTDAEIQKLLLTYRLEELKEKWEQSGYKAFEKSKQFNAGSWQQKKLLLKFMGLEVKNTSKLTLRRIKGSKLIDLMLQHSEFAKLYNAFVKAFTELETLPIIHTTYNQVSEDANDEDDMYGIRTGRLSCKEPNLQQIPSRTENGQKLRRLFVPRNGNTLIMADYSQIELRLAAHFSHDPILCTAFKSGEDVHDATSKALGVDRFYGKTANFLLAFGGSYKRLMDSLNIDEEKAKEFFGLYWQKFKVLDRWKTLAVRNARDKGGVRTITGRWVPVENLRSTNPMLRSKAERRAISCIIQGSAADIIKLAMIDCVKADYLPLLTVHDELVFEVLKRNDWLNQNVTEVRDIMENVIKLDVPLLTEVGFGQSWGEAKHQIQ